MFHNNHYAVAALMLIASASAALGQATNVKTTAATPSLYIPGTLTFDGFTLIAPKGGRLMAFSATSVPADGAVTPDGCWKVAPVVSGDTSTMTTMGNVPGSVLVLNGLVLVFSDGSDCYTLHKSNAEFISASIN